MTQPNQATLTTGHIGPRIVLTGDIDILATTEVRERLAEAIVDRPNSIEFDLRDVTFIDSSGLGTLASATQDNRTVTLIGPSPLTRRLLQAVGMTAAFTILDSPPEDPPARP